MRWLAAVRILQLVLKRAFIQYWLINYGTTCPTNWNTYETTYGNDCWRNGNAVYVPVQTITNLAQLRLTGEANSGGTDTVIMSTPSGDAHAANQDSVLNLSQGWQIAEFNIFGDCCLSQAYFNIGVTIVVRTSVNNGTTSSPTCVTEGFTGETNNLNLVGACSVVAGASPAIVFKESWLRLAFNGCPRTCLHGCFPFEIHTPPVCKP